MRFASVEYEKKGNVALLTMDEQAKLNSLSPGIREGFSKGLDEAEKDDEVKAIVITGAGRAFCAGMDLGDVDLAAVPMWKRMKDVLPNLHGRVEKLSKPVIAAVNGMALGGGFELALACDFIIASEKAVFGAPECKIGVLPPFALVRLPQLVGRPRAKEMIMLGENVPAADALAWGMINKVTSKDSLMDEAMAFAEKLAALPVIALGLAKSALNRDLGGEELVYCLDATPLLFASEDAQEGISAFLEKRAPVFKGR